MSRYSILVCMALSFCMSNTALAQSDQNENLHSQDIIRSYGNSQISKLRSGWSNSHLLKWPEPSDYVLGEMNLVRPERSTGGVPIIRNKRTGEVRITGYPRIWVLLQSSVKCQRILPRIEFTTEIDQFRSGRRDRFSGIDLESDKPSMKPSALRPADSGMAGRFNYGEAFNGNSNYAFLEETSVNLLQDVSVDNSPLPSGSFTYGFNTSTPPSVPYMGVRNSRQFPSFGGNLPRGISDGILLLRNGDKYYNLDDAHDATLLRLMGE